VLEPISFSGGNCSGSSRLAIVTSIVSAQSS
jgi:hypothetical protein